jgi:hypothetical protein
MSLAMYLSRLSIALFLVFGVLIVSSCSPQETTSNEARAVIVDQLSELEPNESFIAHVSQTIMNYGFDQIDVYQGEELGLKFFIDLPQKGYGIIILRVHSGLIGEGEEQIEGCWLFTNEPYQQAFKYTDKRLTRKIAMGRIDEEHPPVFAIGSNFVTGSMNGEFSDALVIAMGCRSSKDDELAEAFISKGASAYIGWSGLVSLDHTDEITLKLIDNLCQKKLTLEEAINATVAEVGAEPSYDTTLRYYPLDSGRQRIDELIRANS